MESNPTKLGPWALLAAAGMGACLCACDGGDGGGDGGSASTTTGGAGGSTTGGTTTGGAGGATGGVGAGSPALPVHEVQSGGSGCPDPAQVTVTYDEAQETLVLEYTSMSLSHPPGSPIQHIHCAVGLPVDVPAGWHFAAGGAAARGTASLPAGVSAVQSTSANFAGQRLGSTSTTELTGPRSGPYTPEETFSPRARAWSPCGGSTIFSIDVDLTLKALGDPQGAAAIDVTRVSIPIVWQGC